MYVVLNEDVVAATDATISIKDRGFLLGDGLFETLLYSDRTLHHFETHFNRLSKSAHVLFIPFEISSDVLEMHCLQLLEKNNLLDKTAALRITLTRGEQSDRGISVSQDASPTVLITAVEYAADPDYAPRLALSDIRRNLHSPLAYHKTLNYLEPILARHAAIAQGYDDALMCNTEGNLAECTVANIFFVMEEALYTPALTEGILPGVMRGHVIACCHKYGIPVHETKLAPEMLSSVTEAFQTNSLIGVQRIAQIDTKVFPPDAAIMTAKLKQRL